MIDRDVLEILVVRDGALVSQCLAREQVEHERHAKTAGRVARHWHVDRVERVLRVAERDHGAVRLRRLANDLRVATSARAHNDRRLAVGLLWVMGIIVFVKKD